jgi:hypothetical protein
MRYLDKIGRDASHAPRLGSSPTNNGARTPVARLFQLAEDEPQYLVRQRAIDQVWTARIICRKQELALDSDGIC